MNAVESARLHDAARAIGRSAGRAAGSWVVDGRMSEDDARHIVEGWEASDPALLDMQPSPLSGEWAGDPTEDDILGDVASQARADLASAEPGVRDDLIAAFLDAYADGYWDEVLRSARRAAGIEVVA